MGTNSICQNKPFDSDKIVPPANPEYHNSKPLSFEPITKAQQEVLQQTWDQLLSGSKTLPEQSCRLSEPVEHEVTSERDGVTLKDKYTITGTRKKGDALYVGGHVFEDSSLCYIFQIYKVPLDQQNPQNADLSLATVASTLSWCVIGGATRTTFVSGRAHNIWTARK